jgi:hypothetical protein
MGNYYVYGHIRNDNGQLFYIGKGTGKRSHSFSNRSCKWKLCSGTEGVTVHIFAKGLTSNEALKLEEKLIHEHKPNANKSSSGAYKEVPYDLLSRTVYYDESSSTFLRWKEDCGWTGMYFSAKKNEEAGVLCANNKAIVMINKVAYSVNRVVWVLHNKSVDVNSVIDHIDGNTANNKIENLREVSVAENARNKKKSARNKSNFTGVYIKNMKGSDFWTATWQNLDGKKIRKSFSILKYGQEQAKQMAINVRMKAMAELNAQGANYTDRHIHS